MMSNIAHLRIEDRLAPIMKVMQNSGFNNVIDLMLAIIRLPQPTDSRSVRIPANIRNRELSRLDQDLPVIIKALTDALGEETAVKKLAKNSDFCSTALSVLSIRIENEAIQLSLPTKAINCFLPTDIAQFSMAAYDRETRSAAPMLVKLLTNAFLLGNEDRDDPKPYVLTVALAMLSNAKNRNCNFFQANVGYYLMSTKTGKRTISVLSRFGITVVYETIHRLQRTIAKSMIAEYQSLAKTRPWILSYDNMNYHAKVKNMLMHKKDHMQNDTAGYLYFPQSVIAYDPVLGHDALRISYTAEECIDRNEALNAKWSDILLTDAEWSYHQFAARAIIYDVLCEHFPGIKTSLEKAKIRPPKMPKVHVLPVEMTPLYTLPTLDLNEARIDETIKIIDAFMAYIGIPLESMNDKLAMVKGDWLTIRNLNLSIFQRQESETKQETLDFVEPVTGMFHTCATMQSILINNFWGNTKEPGSLARFAAMSRNNRVKKKTEDFRAGRYFVNQVLDAHIVSATCAAVEIMFPRTGTREGAAVGFNDLSNLANDVNTKHNWLGVIDSIVSSVFDRGVVHNMRNKENEETGDMEGIPIDERDPARENALLFLRDALVMRDYQLAVKAGDTGRIANIIRYWCIFTQDTPNVNYAQEMIHFVLCFKRLWKKPLIDLWLNNSLVNPAGKAHGWLEDDLFGEYVIRENKGRIRPNTNAGPNDHNRMVNAPQIMLYYVCRKNMCKTVDAKDYGYHSSEQDSSVHVQSFADALTKDKVFHSTLGSYKVSEMDDMPITAAKDLITAGMAQIRTGVPIRKYMSKARCLWRTGKASLDDVVGEELTGVEGLATYGEQIVNDIDG